MSAAASLRADDAPAPVPPLRWAGGKRSLIPQMLPHLPPASRVRSYAQPFVGGGSPFWQLYSGVRHAILADSNGRLTEVYIAIRDHVESLILQLGWLESLGYSARVYADVRDQLNRGEGDIVDRAAAFVVINRWGFNGLWRVNRAGDCNVPFGRTASGRAPVLVDAEVLRACSRHLAGVTILTEDFADTMARAEAGALLYLDPPYAPVSDTASFTGYTAGGFSYAAGGDHDRLLAALDDADRRGVTWALSQSDVPAVRQAYQERGWTLHTVRARRSINSAGEKRGPVGELLVIGRVRL